MTDNLKTRIAEALRPLATRSSPNASQYVIEQAAQAVLDIVEPMLPKWRDIKDAPKDEIDYGYDGIHSARVLAWDVSWHPTSCAVVAYWDDDHWQVDGRDDATTHFKPTHWMPMNIPTPPEKE